jgi:hypothetical protein
MSARFKDRPKRIARRTEREKFERSVMPAGGFRSGSGCSGHSGRAFPLPLRARTFQQGARRTMSGAAAEPKRWKLARAAVWGAILLGTAFFWLAVAAGSLAWLR